MTDLNMAVNFAYHPNQFPFESRLQIAFHALDDAQKRCTVRIARATDATDGGNRRNRLPPDHRLAAMQVTE